MTVTTPPGWRVAHLDCGRQWRGGQAQVMWLMEGLARRGVHNLLLAPRGPLLERARAQRIEHRAWSPRGDLDLAALWSASRVLSAARPHIVHCHDARSHALGVTAARLARVPVVVVSRRVALSPRGWWSALKYRMPVDRYLCVSDAVMEAMRRAGVPQKRLVRVPDGIPASVPAPPPDLRTRAGIEPGALVVVTVAALTAEKRHQDLLEAAASVCPMLPGVHFVWLGEGPCRGALERQRDQLGLTGRVHLLGFHPEAAGLMHGATVAALASEQEGIGTSLIEAQAAGIPVVATAVGGIPEAIVDGVTGKLVPARCPEALAAALFDVLTHPEKARELGRAGREKAGEFHIDRTVERTLSEYLSLIDARASAA